MMVELAAIGEFINISIIKNDTRRAEVVDRDTEIFLIKENEKDKNLLIEVTNMHISIAKS